MEPLIAKTTTTASSFFGNLIKDLAEEDHTNFEQRTEQRHSCTLCMTVQPLNDSRQPSGPSFMAITRDVSNSGVGFIDNVPFSWNYIRIGVPQEEEQFDARVCYNRPVGDENPSYLIGVEFLSKQN